MKIATSKTIPLDAMLRQRVRRDLHGHPRTPAVAHPRQQALEVGGLRGGTRERHGVPGDRGLRSVPSDPGVHPAARKIGLQEIGDGRLAVRAGHAHSGHRRGWIVERDGRHRPHRLADRCGRALVARPGRASAPPRAATAPALTAATAYSCPSAWRPGMQKNSAPGRDLTRVEGDVADQDPASPRILDPGTTRAIVVERNWGEGGCHRPELTRAPPRGFSPVMAVRTRGAESERPGRSGCPTAGSRIAPLAGTAERPRRRRRRSSARLRMAATTTRGSPSREEPDERRDVAVRVVTPGGVGDECGPRLAGHLIAGDLGAHAGSVLRPTYASIW